MLTVDFPPMVKGQTSKTTPVTMRVETPLLERVDKLAERLIRTTRTDIFHAALEEYLTRHEAKPEKPAKKPA